MEAIAHSPSFAKKVGVPQSVGQDFAAADKALKLPTNTRTRADLQTVNNPKTNQGRNELFKEGGNTMATKMDPRVMAMIAARARGMGARPPMAPSGGDMPPMGMKKGGMAKGGMAKGGMAAFEKSGKDVEKKGMKEGSKADMALDKKQMAGMKKGGMAGGGTFRASANGIASKGKTQGTQIKMNKGGKAC